MTDAATARGFFARLGLEGCVRLPLRVAWERIGGELSRLPESTWSRKDRNPFTNADVLSFYAVGHRRGPVVHHTDDLPPLSELPSLREVVREELPGATRRVIVASLRAGGLIPRHRDAAEFFRDTIRLSICIAADEDARTLCGGRWYRMRPGEVWALDNLSPHGVLNDGREARIHVVVDKEPDDSLLDLLRGGDRELGVVDAAAERRLVLWTGLRLARYRLKRLGERLRGGEPSR